MSFEEWLGPYFDGMARAVSDGTVRTVAHVGRTVSFVTPVSDGHRLTPGMPC
jgi:hypothetical protein